MIGWVLAGLAAYVLAWLLVLGLCRVAGEADDRAGRPRG